MKRLRLLIISLLWIIGITSNAEEIPNDEIWFITLDKLNETTDIGRGGLHTNAFSANIISISYKTIINGGLKGIIKFDNDLTSIGDRAFTLCQYIYSITIPNSVTSIGYDAFGACSGLTSINIPSSVTSIGEYAFKDCSSLKSITIPDSVTNIGNYAFDGCTSLPVVDDLRYADTYLVEAVDKTLSTYNIKEGTKWIGNAAFGNCTNMESIEIPNSIVGIGVSAFIGCKNMHSIIIPNSVTVIGGNPFINCSGLEQITVSKNNKTYADFESNVIINTDNLELISGCKNSIIPIGTNRIGDYAFFGCSSLTSIDIPNSVTTIGNSAFSDCSSLQSVKVSWNRPLSIGYTFTGVNYSTCILYVPKGTAQLYMVAPEWINFKNIQEYSLDADATHYITLKQGDAGNIQQEVEVGKCYNYKINAAEGWSVNSVSFNGTDVTKSLIEGRYTTPVITGNSELNVVFRQEGSGVKDLINSNVKVLASNGSVIISGNGNNDPVVVYSVGGAEVASDAGNCNIHLNAGVYLIKVGTEVFKVAL